jgi:restriction system protein
VQCTVPEQTRQQHIGVNDCPHAAARRALPSLPHRLLPSTLARCLPRRPNAPKIHVRVPAVHESAVGRAPRKRRPGTAQGIWRVTEKGKVAHLDGPDIHAIFRRVQELKAFATAGGEAGITVEALSERELVLKDGEEEAIAPSPQTSPYSDHRPGLVKLIAAMTPAGFEEFCSELLTRVGVEDVQTTRSVKDGGVDGNGRLRVNEFVSQPIAFQSKKLDGSGRKVTSEEIQRFRGAMGGHIAKGIFFTTTTFSEDARLEARAPGRVEIELVDLDRILEIREKYLIGLNEQKILVLEPSFFEERIRR